MIKVTIIEVPREVGERINRVAGAMCLPDLLDFFQYVLAQNGQPGEEAMYLAVVAGLEAELRKRDPDGWARWKESGSTDFRSFFQPGPESAGAAAVH